MVTNPDQIANQVPRRNIAALLPQINQTRSIQAFFSNVVNPLYQPEAVTQAYGYIGSKPSYYNPNTDVYLTETTVDRTAYQLSPIMVSIDQTTGNIDDALFYEDLTNRLRFQGGNVDNQSNLFQQDYYSWCPPITIDKILNPSHYFWVPEPEPWIIIGPSQSFKADGTTTIYTTSLLFSTNLTVVQVNDEVVSSSSYGTMSVNGKLTVQFTNAPEDGDSVQIFSYSDFDDIVGQPTYSFTDGLTLSSGQRLLITNDINPAYNGNYYIVENVGNGIILVPDPALENAWDIFPWDTLGWDLTDTRTSPDYLIIQRGGLDHNPWAFGNRWFNQQVLQPADLLTYRNSFATRPIIEFEFDVELYDYGLYARTNVDLVSTSGSDIFSLLDSLPNLWDESEYDINAWDSLIIDGIQLQAGQRILILNDTNSNVQGRIFSVVQIQISSSTYIFSLVLDTDGLNQNGSPVYGEKVYVNSGIQYGGLELWFNGNVWTNSQVKTQLNQAPLFQLYDVEQNQLQNPGTHPGSNFQGNKVFSFQLNPTGFTDAALGLNLTYNSEGEIIFQDYITQPFDYPNQTTNYSDTNGSILGYYFYHVYNLPSSSELDVYSCNWWKTRFNSFQYFVEQFTIGASNVVHLNVPPIVPISGQSPNQLPTIRVTLNYIEIEINQGFTVSGADVTVTNAVSGDTVVVTYVPSVTPTTEEGYWTIPINLMNNPGNDNVSYLGLNDMFEHFVGMMQDQDGFTGSATYFNNSRDIPFYRNLGDVILSNRAPLLPLMMMCSNTNLDFTLATQFAEREYARFRNKFLQNMLAFYNQGILTPTDTPDTWVDLILQRINLGKSKASPFVHSGMAGDLTYIPGTPSYLGFYPIYPPTILLDSTYSPPQNVILCHDGSLMIAFNDFRDQIILDIETRIYQSIRPVVLAHFRPMFDIKAYTGGKFRRAGDFAQFWNTASAIQWQPSTEYNQGVLVQNGLDFFFTTAVYTSGSVIADDLRNYDLIFIQQYPYSMDDLNAALLPSFQRWATTKQVDYQTNQSYVPGDPFTYNYAGSFDVDGDRLPGYWRQIYQYYYDTDRPHICPWEMLGFTAKPAYWDSRYGPAPYTRGNSLLWTDLENGYVFSDPNSTDNNFIRPGLSSFIPVDDYGNLLDPILAGIVSTPPSYQEASAPWKFGDGGPVETAWRKSEYFPFDLAMASYLLLPALFSQLAWQPDKFEFVYDQSYLIAPFTSGPQWIDTDFNERPRYSQLTVHEEIVNGRAVVNLGYQQWISDYLLSLGLNITTSFGDAIRGLNVQLGHKAGGFIDSNQLTAFADNFGLILPNNISVLLYNSPSIREEVYSGVIVEWTGQGWRVYGYDVLNPTFTIIPSDTNAGGIAINIGQDEPSSIPDWQPNTYYSIGNTILYQSLFYVATVSHTSSNSFELPFWTPTSSSGYPTILELTYYQFASNTVATVPYGTVFNSRQDVFNFLIGYGNFLTTVGWIFDSVDQNSGQTKDWIFSGREFGLWSLTQWEPGSFISLSPASLGLKFQTSQGTVQSVEQLVNGVYSLLDRSGSIISMNNVNVLRYDYLTYIEPNNGVGIFCSRISITEIEHVVVFDNFTDFGNLIYEPLLGLAQSRLKVDYNITLGWNGRVFAPGFILTSSTSLNMGQTVLTNDAAMVPNFEKTVSDFTQYMNVSNPVENNTIRDYAYHNVGFQPRDYLTNLQITDPGTQFQFYQGMISNIGIIGGFTPILRSSTVTLNTDTFQIYEEWAFRIGGFGGTGVYPSIELLLQQKSIKNFTQLITFDLLVSNNSGIEIPWDPNPPNSSSTFDLGNFDVDMWDPSTTTALNIINNDNAYNGNLELIDEITTNGQIIIKDPRWERRPTTFGDSFEPNTQPNNNIFPLLPTGSIIENQLPTAGYVKLGEFTYSYLNMIDFTNDLANIGSQIQDRDLIWIYSVEGNQTWSEWPYDWTMIRVTNPTAINAISRLDPNPTVQGNPTTVTLVGPHNLQNGELVLIPNTTSTSPDLEGLHLIATTYTGITLASNQFLVTDTSLQVPQVYITTDVASVTVLNGGTGFTSVPSIVFTGGNGSGVVASVLMTTSTVAAASGGTGYVVGDVLTVIGGNPNTVATATVVSVNSGVITGLVVTTSGSYVSVPSNPCSTSGGSGSGATLTLTYSIQSVSVIENGSGYNSIPTVSVVGGAGSNASLLAVLDTSMATTPDFFVLREVRFTNLAQRDASFTYNATYDPFQYTELVWVNDARTATQISEKLAPFWATFIRSNLYDADTLELLSPWRLLRKQNQLMNTSSFKNSLIYNKTSNTTVQYLQVFDPAKGLIPGAISSEIYYQTSYDPAFYNSGPNTATNLDSMMAWGEEQVGRVWWNLSTTRFLDYEIGDDLEPGFYQYRTENWGSLAPGISPDVYEWVRSPISPSDWISAVQNNTVVTNFDGSTFTPTGTVLNTAAPSFSVINEWSQTQQQIMEVYYFWVDGLTSVPDVSFRHISVQQIASMIESPNLSGISWFSPIAPNAMIVSNVSQFLDNLDTVLQVNWQIGDSNNLPHYQWILQRETDPNSSIDQTLINKMRDSLVGWDGLNNVVPDPNLSDVEMYGNLIRPRQTWFQNRSLARQNFVDSLNDIFAAVPLTVDRLGFEQQIFLSTPTPTQQVKLEFAGVNKNTFYLPLYYQTTGLCLYVYDDLALTFTTITNFTVQYDPITGFQEILLPIALTSSQTLYVNNQNYWQLSLPDITDLGFLSPQIGDFVLIINDSRADNFWTLSVWTGTVYQLVVAQTYRLYPDFLNLVNWYATGYDSTSVPNRFFTSLNQRNASVNTLLNGDLVQWIDLTTGLFEWDIYKNGQFTMVAKQNATIELSSQFYTSDVLYGFGNYVLSDIPIRDGSWELKVLINNLGLPLILNTEIAQMFFDMVRYVHSEQNMVDWVFKTSTIYLGEFLHECNQLPIAAPDNVQYILDYIDEIKPYHVFVRDYVDTYYTLNDAQTHATDFDLPIYYDTNLNQYRILNPTNVVDQQILKTVEPYSDWWEAYQTDETLIRNLTITLAFDRVNCQVDFGWDTMAWDTIPWDFDFNLVLEGLVIQVNFNGTLLPYQVVSADTITLTNSEMVAGIATIDFYWANVLSTVDPTSTNLEMVGSIWYNQSTSLFWVCTNVNYQIIPFQATWMPYVPTAYYTLSTPISGDLSSTITIPDLTRAATRIVENYQPTNGMPALDLTALIGGCEFQGTIIDGYTFADGIWDVYQYDDNKWDYEIDQQLQDINLVGGQVPQMVSYLVGSFDHSEWDDSLWDSFNIDYGITWSNPVTADLFVYLNDNVLTLGVDYTVSGTTVIVNAITSIAAGSMEFGLTPNDLISALVTITQGTTFLPATNNPYDIVVDGNQFIQPQVNGNRPEELVAGQTPETLMLTVSDSALSGSPPVQINTFHGNGSTTYQLYQQPQSNQAILVYENGYLMSGGYSIEFGAQQVVFASPTASSSLYQIISFGIGGQWDGYDSYGWDLDSDISWDFNTNVLNTFYFLGDGSTSSFELIGVSNPPLSNSLLVTIDGVVQSSYSLVGNDLVFNSPPSNGSDIFITILSAANGLIQVLTDTFTTSSGVSYLDGQLFTLSQTVGPTTPLEGTVIATIVNANGTSYRLTPSQYQIVNGNQIYVPFILASNEDLVVISFGNDAPMNLITDIWTGSSTGMYTLSQIPADINHVFVYLNGILQNDYQLQVFNTFARVVFSGPQFSSDTVMITSIVGPVATLPTEERAIRYERNTLVELHTITVTSANYVVSGFEVMLNNPPTSDSIVTAIVNSVVVNATVNGAMVLLSVVPSIGDIVVVRVDNPNLGEWEYLSISPTNTTFLKNDVLVTDTEVQVYVTNLVPSAQLPDIILPIPQPASNKPGIVWVDEERIEYWSIRGTGIGTDVELFDGSGRRYLILGQLIRGTKGTPYGPYSTTQCSFYTGNDVQTVFALPSQYSIGMTVWVLVNGVVMTDYALVGTNIVFNLAPVLNTSIVLQVLTSSLLTATLSHIVGTEVVNGLSFIPGISAEGSMIGI